METQDSRPINRQPVTMETQDTSTGSQTTTAAPEKDLSDKDILDVMLEKKNESNQVDLIVILDHFEDPLVASFNAQDDIGRASWKTVDRRLAITTTTATPADVVSSSSSLPTLKTRITEQQKDVLRERFKKFTEEHKEDFWYLESTIAQATKDETDPVSVEEKVMNFALSCHYYHPSQSLILEVTDKNWKKVFTEAELRDIENKGGPLECKDPEELKRYYLELKGVKTSTEVFKYARSIEINDPSAEHLKVWFSSELSNVARLFLKTRSFDISNMPETDQQYLPFGFFGTIFDGSDIVAKGTEVSSEANAHAINSSRQLSSITAISNRKMGRRGDTIFKYGSEELGCSEVGAARDQTKAFRDCSMKMPLVLRDMLLSATYDSSLLHAAHVIGYSIIGGSASLLDVNIPAGFITRVRKTEPLKFPHTDSNLISRLLPLMTLAYNGKKILDKTADLLDNVPQRITMSSNGTHWCLPPNFIIPSPSSSSSSSPSKRIKVTQ
ncbi:hypothetical protein INT45_005297 [Circinella minor]|uniref:Uncharacterized protein n=1 Tax=Circinella minor TaxID=1195481 RepID=A0A8H7SB31_9FUNG|nr:hypothetical protein INT45_005297 [Circinella minor]